MALIIEDGSGVENADSYVSAADARTYASARGVTLPADDTALEALILKGMDYLEAQRANYQGGRTYTGFAGQYADDSCFPIAPPADIDTHAAQSLQWPRYGVYLDDVPISGNTIPRELVSALCQCAIEIGAGGDLQANSSGQVVKSEKVDVLQTTYMTADEMGSVGVSNTFPKVDALLAPLFGGNGTFLKSVRV